MKKPGLERTICRAAGVKNLEKALLRVQINSHYVSVHESLHLRWETVGGGVLMGHVGPKPIFGWRKAGTSSGSPAEAKHFGRGNIPACWKMETH